MRMTPFAAPATEGQRDCNRMFVKDRIIIEQVFGIAKRRFPIIKNICRVKTERIPRLIAACFVLHNMGINQNDPPPAEEEAAEEDNQEVDDDLTGIETRRLGQ